MKAPVSISMLNAGASREELSHWLNNGQERQIGLVVFVCPLLGTHLVCNIRSRIADIAVHLAHDSDMLVAIQE